MYRCYLQFNTYLTYLFRLYYGMTDFPSAFFRNQDNEELNLSFKTDQRNGLLWYSGDADKHAYAALEVNYKNKCGLVLDQCDYSIFNLTPSLTLQQGRRQLSVTLKFIS